MKIICNLRPQILKGKFIKDVRRDALVPCAKHITKHVEGYLCGGNYPMCVAFNIVKKKAKRTRLEDGAYKKVTENEVILYRYMISLQTLRDLNLKVIQGNRTFKIEKLK